MSDFYNFAGQPPKSGGGPEEDPNHPVNAARTEGFHVLPFGIALGLMFLLFFGFFNSFLPRPGIDIWSRFVFSFEPMLGMVYFIYGFIAGIAIAAVYNVLVIHKLFLHGIERGRD